MSVLSTQRQPTKSELLASFTNGVRPDQQLYQEELQVQRAWARALGRLGKLTTEEVQKIISTLDLAANEMSAGTFQWREEDEDIHMNLERFVEEKAALGKKMHLGRSRNDLIATTLKLHVARSSQETIEGLKEIIHSLIALSQENLEVIVPGMTHLQNGQPVRWSHVLLSHAQNFLRDLEKFSFVKTRALANMPLGSAALSGTTLPVDLNVLAQELGFNSPSLNSYDSVGERDALIDYLQAAAHFGAHLSRLCEDIIYWASAPVSLVRLSPDWSTGSSIMPNKRNPDVAELARGKAALWIGQSHGVLSLVKGMGTSYGSDLHETKVPYLSTVNDLLLTLSVFPHFLGGLSISRKRAQELLSQGHILATEIANKLTDQGLPFREAYAQVAALVEVAEAQGLEVHELPEVIHMHLSFQGCVEERSNAGGTALSQVKKQIEQLQLALDKF